MYTEKTFYGGVYIEKGRLEEDKPKYNIEIEYYKTKSFKKYGIEIIKKEYKEETIKIEKAKIENLTKQEKKRNRILETLKRNEVTPITLPYIMSDMGFTCEMD